MVQHIMPAGFKLTPGAAYCMICGSVAARNLAAFPAVIGAAAPIARLALAIGGRSRDAPATWRIAP